MIGVGSGRCFRNSGCGVMGGVTPVCDVVFTLFFPFPQFEHRSFSGEQLVGFVGVV
jgi:hypothetical protein